MSQSEASATAKPRHRGWRSISPGIDERSAPPLSEPLISHDELARRLGISTDNLAEERVRGRVDGYRIRGQWRYARWQIDIYLDCNANRLAA
jgi:hypothetical protein